MTAIQDKYQQLGGENGFLGKALNTEQLTPTFQGLYQEYEHGMIYYHVDFGAHVLTESVVAKWKSNSVANVVVGNTGSNIRDYMGFPTQDTKISNEGGEVCYFERGMIVIRKNGKAFVVYGAVYLAYRMQNDINGFIGYPTADEKAGARNGRVAKFEGADIYWHQNTGAFEVHGDIRKKYNALGAEACEFLGYPSSNESIIFNGTQEVGRASKFEGGTIFWSRATGAHEVRGALLKTYIEQLNGPTDSLGFPTSDGTLSPNGMKLFNNFQNGVLVLNTQNGAVNLVKRIIVSAQRFETDEDDDDLIVQTKVTIDDQKGNVRQANKQFGEFSNKGTVDPVPDGLLLDMPINDGNTIVSVYMKAIEVDDFLNGSDDFIADFTKSFSVDTLWDASLADMQGNLLKTFYSGPDGKFRASILIDFGDKVNPNDSENFRRNLFWKFHNPHIAELSFETYAATFSDVEADDSWGWHLFNHIYYETAYKNAAEKGTCFGMCLEAIYALLGRSASRQFISQHDFDTTRTNDISIKFGYQLGAHAINYFISNTKNGRMWNPVENFEFSQAKFEQRDYTLLCMSKGISPIGGHVVLPYRWEKVNDEFWRIYVANPNTPFAENPNNDAPDSVIMINPKTNTFIYNHKPAENGIWTGGQGIFNGGRMFAMPYSELSTPPRTPFWEVVATFFTGGAYLIFAGDSADIDQVSDESGNTLLTDNGDYNTNSASRIKNILPIEHYSHRRPFDIGHMEHRIPVDMSQFLKKMVSFGMYHIRNTPAKVKMYPDAPLRINPNHIGSSSKATKLNTKSTGRIGKALNNPSSFKLNVHKQSSQASDLASQLASPNASAKGDIIGQVFPKSKSLNINIRNHSEGNYQIGFVSGKSKILLSANAVPSTLDKLSLEAIGDAKQAVRFTPHENAINKTLTITITSFDNSRTYEISNLSLNANQAFTLQHTNACKELILQDLKSDIAFDLKIFVGKTKTPALIKNISLEASAAINLSPANWLELEQGINNAQLNLQFLNQIDGNILKTVII